MNNFSTDEIKYLLTPKAIRDTTAKVYQLAKNGSTHFNLYEEKIDACADYVMDVIKENYPTFDIPFHSRWGHFKIGAIDRESILDKKINQLDKLEQARIKLDLVVTSVLLDAGAGPTWKFFEDGQSYNRSEGLAVASFNLFMQGALASDQSLKADAKGLQNISQETLKLAFQVSEENPLIGVAGRVELLNKLGKSIADNPTIFPGGRVGSIVDYLIAKHGNNFEVGDILNAVLLGLGPIWPGRIEAQGINLGDVWEYAPIKGVVCFHKLSQWLTYSLVTPMQAAGLEITGAEKLTGLAEYRNGGLFLDFGVISLKDEKDFEKAHKPASELIIEWRALTLQLLDKVGALVQAKLGKSASEFPLAKVLEGGTWWAGRKIAKEKRSDGSTPLKLDSDGTVF